MTKRPKFSDQQFAFRLRQAEDGILSLSEELRFLRPTEFAGSTGAKTGNRQSRNVNYLISPYWG